MLSKPALFLFGKFDIILLISISVHGDKNMLLGLGGMLAT